MIRYIALALAVVFIAGTFALSCKTRGTKGMTKEEFVSIQSEVGCAQATKGTLAAAEIYEKKRLTADQIGKFMESLDVRDQMEVSQEIARRVAKCFEAEAE